MKCIGSVQHLKNKFLGGYTVHVSIHIDASTSDINSTEKYIIQAVLPEGTTLVERHGRFLTFEIPHMKSSTLSSLFQSMQDLKQNEAFFIDNYSISQCTLEQVFMQFTKN